MATAYDPTKDRFASVAADPTFSARRAFPVSLSDTKDMTDRLFILLRPESGAEMSAEERRDHARTERQPRNKPPA
jgi:hypothetical protein